MRTLGVAVVILGMAALAFIAMDAVQTAGSGVPAHATTRENGGEFPRLMFWTIFFGVMALATVATGLADVVMSRRDRNPAAPPREPDGEKAPPSPGLSAAPDQPEVMSGFAELAGPTCFTPGGSIRYGEHVAGLEISESQRSSKAVGWGSSEGPLRS